MYKIQAYNLKTNNIDIFTINSHEEKMLFVKKLRDSLNYGSIQEFYNARY